MFIRDTIANQPTVSNIDGPASPSESSLLRSNAIHATITTDKTPEQLFSLPTTSQKRSSDRSASRVPMKKAMIDPGDQYIIEALKRHYLLLCRSYVGLRCDLLASVAAMLQLYSLSSPSFNQELVKVSYMVMKDSLLI